jgi:hypothetical protein
MFARISLLLLALAPLAPAQDVISARAGWINYKHGDIALPRGADGQDVRQLEAGQTAATQFGRLEILLNPGSFLRLDSESAVRLLTNELTNVQVELLSGTVNLEVNEAHSYWLLAVLWGDQKVPIEQKGLYRFELGQESLRVFVASGKLKLAGQTLKAGNWIEVQPSGELLAAGKFDPKNWDDFDLWNRGRSYQVAQPSRTVVSDAFYGYPGYYSGSGLWYWDPLALYYRYAPYGDRVASPWGYYYVRPPRSHPSHPKPPASQPVASNPPAAGPPGNATPPPKPPRLRPAPGSTANNNGDQTGGKRRPERPLERPGAGASGGRPAPATTQVRSGSDAPVRHSSSPAPGSGGGRPAPSGNSGGGHMSSGSSSSGGGHATSSPASSGGGHAASSPASSGGGSHSSSSGSGSSSGGDKSPAGKSK